MKRFLTVLSICAVIALCISVSGFIAPEITVANDKALADNTCNHVYANNGEYIVINEPTCTLKGTKYRTCLICSDKDIVETPKDPDNHSLVSNVLTYETMPTCVQGGLAYYLCIGCNRPAQTVEVDPDPNAHSKNGDFIILRNETCVSEGEMAHQCKYCDEYFNHKTIPSDPASHVITDDSVWTITILPTCNTVGSMECTCDACGQIGLVREIPATNEHVPTEEWFTISEPTCSSDGVRAQLCTVCASPVNEIAIPAQPHNHDFSDEYTVDIAATCVSKGEKSRHCANCDAKYDITEIPVDSKGHVYTDEWIVTKEPTCSESGFQHRVCTLCDEDSVSMIIAKLPHTYPEEYEVLQESADGRSARVMYVCTECSYEYVTIITIGSGEDGGDIGDTTDPENKIYKITTVPGSVIRVDYETMMISNVQRNLTVGQFLSKFTNSHVFVIYDTKSNFINEEDNIGTGCRLNYETPDGYVTNYYVCVTGDLDSDGKVTAADARLLLRASAKIDNLTEPFRVAADVNLDGKITAADARKTLLVAANMTYFEETYEY